MVIIILLLVFFKILIINYSIGPIVLEPNILCLLSSSDYLNQYILRKRYFAWILSLFCKFGSSKIISPTATIDSRKNIGKIYFILFPDVVPFHFKNR